MSQSGHNLSRLGGDLVPLAIHLVVLEQAGSRHVVDWLLSSPSTLVEQARLVAARISFSMFFGWSQRRYGCDQSLTRERPAWSGLSGAVTLAVFVELLRRLQNVVVPVAAILNANAH